MVPFYGSLNLIAAIVAMALVAFAQESWVVSSIAWCAQHSGRSGNVGASLGLYFWSFSLGRVIGSLLGQPVWTLAAEYSTLSLDSASSGSGFRWNVHALQSTCWSAMTVSALGILPLLPFLCGRHQVVTEEEVALEDGSRSSQDSGPASLIDSGSEDAPASSSEELNP
jgi:hypothetical protein